jgi:hypothetical protein
VGRPAAALDDTGTTALGTHSLGSPIWRSSAASGPKRTIGGEATGTEDGLQAAPIHGVEGFGEVEFDDDRRCFSFLAALNDLHGMDESFRDASPLQEAGLVSVDQC